MSYKLYESKLLELEKEDIDINKLYFLKNIERGKRKYVIEDGDEKVRLIGFNKINGEERNNFADGNSTYDSAEVICETLWKVHSSKKVYICKIIKGYVYICNAHCGGASEADLSDFRKGFCLFEDYKEEFKMYKGFSKYGEKKDKNNYYDFNITKNEKINKLIFLVVWVLSTTRLDNNIFRNKEFELDQNLFIELFDFLTKLSNDIEDEDLKEITSEI